MDAALLADVANLDAGKRTRSCTTGPPAVSRAAPARRTRLHPSKWDEALELVARQLRSTEPDFVGVYMTSRGQPNEKYYATQKVVRAQGTNSIDSAARLCHSRNRPWKVLAALQPGERSLRHQSYRPFLRHQRGGGIAFLNGIAPPRPGHCRNVNTRHRRSVAAR